MSRMLLFAALSLCGSAFATINWSPTVKLSGRILQGTPSGIHHPEGQGIEILEKDECAVRELGGARVEVPARCEYLHGIYRYIFTPEDGAKRLQMLMEFSLTRKSAASYTLLVDGPVEIEQR